MQEKYIFCEKPDNYQYKFGNIDKIMKNTGKYRQFLSNLYATCIDTADVLLLI